jgi:hypothetical protein
MSDPLLHEIVRAMLTHLLAVCDADECADWKVGFIRSAVTQALQELEP